MNTISPPAGSSLLATVELTVAESFGYTSWAVEIAVGICWTTTVSSVSVQVALCVDASVFGESPLYEALQWYVPG